MNDPTHDRAPAPNALTPAQEERLSGVLLNQIHAFAKYYGLNTGAVVDSVARLAERRFYRASLGGEPEPTEPAPIAGANLEPSYVDERLAELSSADDERELTSAEGLELLVRRSMEFAHRCGRKPHWKMQRRFDEYERQRALAAPLPEGVARFRPRSNAS